MTPTTPRRRTGIGAGIAAVAALALLTACGSGTATSGAAAPATAGMGAMAGMGPMGDMSSTGNSTKTAGTTVVVKDFSFTPASMTVPAGTAVTWIFDDSAQHTVTATDKSFSSAALNDGHTYTHMFTTPGTYHYICSIHQYMTGTITVTPAP